MQTILKNHLQIMPQSTRIIQEMIGYDLCHSYKLWKGL